LAEARVGYWEYSGDPIALCVAHTGQGGYRLGVLLGGVVWGGGRLEGERYSPRGEGEGKGEGGDIALGGVCGSCQERIRMGGSCQERIRMVRNALGWEGPVRNASGWEGPVRTCQDDQDDQENQNPVRRPPGSWHPNKMLM